MGIPTAIKIAIIAMLHNVLAVVCNDNRFTLKIIIFIKKKKKKQAVLEINWLVAWRNLILLGVFTSRLLG